MAMQAVERRGTGKTIFELGWSWDNFLGSVQNHYRIQNRDGGLYEPWGPLFERKRIQCDLARCVREEFERGGPARIAAVKPRKAGCSTLMAGLGLDIATHLPWTVGIVAHVDTTADYIFGIGKNMHELDERGDKPEAKYSRGNVLVFPGPGGSDFSRLATATAKGAHPFTAWTIQFLLMDECAKYEGDDERQNKLLASVMGSVPTEGASLVMKLSTANGAEGDFYNTVMEAYEAEQKGKRSDWRLFFAPWFNDEMNQLPVEEDYDWGDWDKSDIERETMLVRLYGLTPEQLRFRRFQIKSLGRNGTRLFEQEYPSSVPEAFISVNNPAFPREMLDKLKLGVEPPLGRWRCLESEVEVVPDIS